MPNDLPLLSGHILLVEDDIINQKIIKNLLVLLGVTVSTASTGQQALSQLIDSPGHFDVVFMDVGLPDINGIEVTRQVRASSSALKDVPIIALTGHISIKDKEACFSVGMNGFISKPTTREVLHQELRKILQFQ